MATEWSTARDYATARNSRKQGAKLEVRGPTYEHRSWLGQAGFVYVTATKRWKRTMPTNNSDMASLLYELTKRGMEWRAVVR